MVELRADGQAAAWWPQAVCQVVHHLFELAAEQLVQLLAPPSLANAVVDEAVVDHDFVLELFGQAILSHLRCSGVQACWASRRCMARCHALIKRQQRLAQCGLADVADDASGNVLVLCLRQAALRLASE